MRLRPVEPRRAAVAAAFLASIAATPLTSQPTPLTVAGVTARAGERASGFIEVPAGVDSATRIPITVVRGSAAGPVLALIAGTHGAEVAPIIALQRLRAQLEPARLRGTLLLVHVANMPSFLHRTVYRGPWDGKNLNRVYPGRRDGTASERIAHAITSEIIDRADYVVDMHAGDANESLRPYTYWSRLGLDARVDSLAREMALAWGNDHIVIDTDRPRSRDSSVYTQNTAQVRGKPAITTESGWLGVAAEEMVQRNVQGAVRLMRHLGMLPDAGALRSEERIAHPLWIDRSQVLTSPATGLWYPRVERGNAVQKGTVLGHVTDFFGARVGEVVSPFAGTVLYVVGTPATSRGEPLAMVGHVMEER
jgi:predicted deacylase